MTPYFTISIFKQEIYYTILTSFYIYNIYKMLFLHLKVIKSCIDNYHKNNT